MVGVRNTYNAATGEYITEEYELSIEELEALESSQVNALVTAMEDYYDLIAQKKRYDNRLTCALRAGYAGPFQEEGASFAVWMDTCNAYAYNVMSQVKSDLRQAPTAEELIAELPSPPWL